MSADQSEHPDQMALRLVYEVLGKTLGEQLAIDLVNVMMNEGVVFRMAQWYIENHLQAGQEMTTAVVETKS